MPTRVENCFKALPTDLVGMGSRVKVIPVNLSLNFFAIHREAADYPSSYPIRIDSEAKSDEDCLENWQRIAIERPQTRLVVTLFVIAALISWTRSSPSSSVNGGRMKRRDYLVEWIHHEWTGLE